MPSFVDFDKSKEGDVEYTWKCNPSENECENTNNMIKGGAIFIILMVVFLLKDLACGLKTAKITEKRDTVKVHAQGSSLGVSFSIAPQR